MEAPIDVPSIGFSWKSDPLVPSKCDFAISGAEVNPCYCDSQILRQIDNFSIR
jgi:hypothetical protein